MRTVLLIRWPIGFDITIATKPVGMLRRRGGTLLHLPPASWPNGKHLRLVSTKQTCLYDGYKRIHTPPSYNGRSKGGFSYGEGCDGYIDASGRLHCGRDDDPQHPSPGLERACFGTGYFSGDTLHEGARFKPRSC